MQDSIVTNKISKGKKVKFILFTLFFLAVIVIGITELILSVTKYQSTYDQMKRFSLTQAKWWACDSVNGPRYVPNMVGEADSIHFLREIWYYKRLTMINNDGYHDRDSFTNIAADSNSLRVLFAGDSFTWGASADIDSSFVDVFESNIKKLKPALVWNTGIPATGTNHALFTVKKYLPLQKTNVVILGFYTGNDFGDNLLPYDNLVFNNLASCYSLYDYDRDFKPFKISKEEAFKKATGSYPMSELNLVQKILVRSRFVTYMSNLKNKVISRLRGHSASKNEQQYKVTKDYLSQLRDYVKENNAELVVLVIPAFQDIDKKGTNYLNALKILDELSIRYVDPYAGLSENDYLKIDGGHWKNSGHIQAGNLLSKYLQQIIVNEANPAIQK
ncbi:MAG: SGNH/GDSL hydrolase family protein [Chitinophagaceae bacterium]|nr:SGNH/GDSL hydrolase family protein [Chitinophagaceae bacterium]